MTNIVNAVKEDLDRRAALGLKKYGVGLERTDLTEDAWIQHAYEEALDLACYLRRLIELRKMMQGQRKESRITRE